MPANPIQRKTKNAFLTGMLLALVIAGIIGSILYFTVFANEVIQAKAKKENGVAYVYKLVTNVKSGETISPNQIETVEISADLAPADFVDGNSAFPSSYKSKLDLTAGTILNYSLLYGEEETDKTVRLAEYNMITFPSTLTVGDYIDIRITMPGGQNYIVISKKEVKSLTDTTIGLYLTEEEILTMDSAIVEAYKMTAANIYAIQYVEAGMQEQAIPTYPVNDEVRNLIYSNPNILNSIKNALKERLEGGGTALRDNNIKPALDEYAGSGLTNLETKMQEQVQKAREAYLAGLAGY